MIQILIRKNTVPSNRQKYSNYIYTYETELTNNCSDSQYYLPYQIETNKAYQDYFDCPNNIKKFRAAILLEENYQTVMNLCVISLINGNFDELEKLVIKAETLAAPDENHHIILLVEYYLLIHVYDQALKHLIYLINNKKLHEVVQNLLMEVCGRKLFSRQQLSNLVLDNNMLEQIIKINKKRFIQYHSNASQYEFQSKHSVNTKLDQFDQYSIEQSASYILEKSNQTLSDQTQKTDSLSLISQTQIQNQIYQQLDFLFIDTIIENPNLFSFQFRIPYMIGSYDIKRINKLSSKIAEGGFGEVFLAKHIQTHEIHALKVIKQQEDQQVEVVLQEIIIQDKIQKLNPQLFLNLKPLVYIKKDSKLTDIYIPLELGQFSLYDYILEHQIYEIEYYQFFNLFIDFIVTLHTHKYAHRDIKPQNILYIKDQGWKLADFGESVNYIETEDVYKIRGTYAFLPYNLRKNHQQRQSEIKQNLLYNDVYAAVCTLVLIKNPNFNSKQLTEYMDNNKYDLQLQLLLEKFRDLEGLAKLKVNQMQNVETRHILKQQIKDQEDSWNCWEKLQYYNEQQLQLDDEFIQRLDEQLYIYKQQQQKHLITFLSFLISKSFPFQIEKFQNIQIFNFQRYLLADFQSQENPSVQYYYTIIDYFIIIKLYEFAIKFCDQLNTREYDIKLHLYKIQVLICLDKTKQAKQELELVSRYFLSVQSYSLNDQIIFCVLHKKLHKEAPSIKIDQSIQNHLINFQNKGKSDYHDIKPDLRTPINLNIVEDKIHLKLRLDVLFEFFDADSQIIDKKNFQQVIQLFGDHFIKDGQLQKHDDLIKLIKENLVFWNSKYIQQTHIIGIGLNYICNYYDLRHVALELGLYFHNILRNVGSCDSIVAHYEHLLELQIIIQECYGEQPKLFLDFNRILQEAQYLSRFDQIYFSLKSMIIWLKIQIQVLQIKLDEEKKIQYQSQCFYLLSSLYQFKDTEYQRQRLIQFLYDMVFQFLKFHLSGEINLLQVIKKGNKLMLQLNRMHHLNRYNSVLKQERQFMLNHQNLLVRLSKNNLDQYDRIIIQKECCKNLIQIYLSPTKAVNKLEKQYGHNKIQLLLSSLDYQRNNDLGHFLQTREYLKKIKRTSHAIIVSDNIQRKINQISLFSQYVNL